jgi:putative addiction module component (TIGR02574 family)
VNKTRRAILECALALPKDDREQIVERLQESLDSDIDELDDGAFRAELLRRREEARKGIDPGIPWSELKKKK